MRLHQYIEKIVSEKKPFVLYRKPGKKQVKVIQQKDSLLYFKEKSMDQKGFVFTDFWNHKSIIFEKDNVVMHSFDFEINTDNNQFDIIDSEHDEEEIKAHIQLVQRGIRAIENGTIEKVVLSRKETVKIHSDKKTDYYFSLLNTYTNAFCYWWYHPEAGEWMGATPEQLIRKNGRRVATVSLAGTQPFTGAIKDVVWQDKEKAEQGIVTEFIHNKLEPFCRNIVISEPYTFQAGNVVHIKTDIEAELSNDESFEHIVDAIHPTPALCGFPQKEAQDFIGKSENYQRTFYGGYLGEYNLEEGSTDLFVNLRCMELHPNQTASLFIGGGITKDSNTEAEWEETVNKSKTLKSIICQNAKP